MPSLPSHIPRRTTPLPLAPIPHPSTHDTAPHSSLPIPSRTLPTTDTQFLEDLFVLTDGDCWTHNEGWEHRRTRPGECYGVVVLDAHVTRLCLPHNALSGQIPGEKSSHWQIRFRSVSDPFQISLQISLTLPVKKSSNHQRAPSQTAPTRTKLTAASFAALLLPATIPTKTTLCTDSVGFCKRLRYLRLDYNRLLGPVPSTIGGDAAHTGCKALEVLGLAGNMLEGRWQWRVVLASWRGTSGARQLARDNYLPAVC